MVEISGRSGSELVLPERIVSVQENFPWSTVESAAKIALAEQLPEFRAEIERLPLSVFGLASGFFYLPAALASEWDSPLPMDDFMVALAIGHVYFAFQDAVVDGGGAPAELCIIAHDALFEYLTRVSAIGWPDVTPDTAMKYALESHRRNYSLYSAAIANDLRHRVTLHKYTSSEIAGLGWKAAPCNTPFEVVALRSGRRQHTADLLESVRYFCAGLQLMDDLSDLAVDHADGNMTMALSHTLLHMQEAGLEQRSADADDVLFAAEVTGVSKVSCRIAIQMFEVARELADRVEAATVAELCTAWIARAGRRLDVATAPL